ncbi:hypothetical protein SAMN04487949_1762 [Halogranum gelatinilyticum]|uniref:Uncharacterized protein n=1 Tax=Halogranum gelatinilyticum TaxID=660521 RepID=A0A1G9TGK6_9EURY|nr:hypothetical protein [Halogranum gelatinilyticum]SDM46742.1 hypothetical protein SAMN04487949_1762 [Halogranum gelatinilyticum]
MNESRQDSSPQKRIIFVFITSVFVSLSTLEISSFGSGVLFLWVLLLALLGFIFATSLAEDLRDMFSGGKEEKETETENPENSDDQLREFIYLDSLSIQSLLASIEFGTPESVRELSERSQTKQQTTTTSANVKASEVGKIEGGFSMSNSETGKEVLETNKRIHDQHRFKELYSNLEDRGKIDVLPADWRNNPDDYNLDSSEMDIVEFRGTAQTDPLYRMMNVISLVTRSISLLTPYLDVDDPEKLENINQDTVEEVRDAVYGNQIGLKVDVSDSDLNYVMALDDDKLWIDNPRREFSGSKEYTVLGRVIGVVGEDNDWDYIDVFRVTSTVLGDESMSTIREVISDLIELVDGFDKEVPVPNFSEMDIENMSEEVDENKSMHTIKIDIEDKDMSVEGPAVIVDPIAVYW